MKKYKISLVCALMALGSASPAKADYNVWTDAKTGVRLSFPDTWKQINNDLPIDVITLSVPSPNEENAECHLQAEEDKRFMIYPNEYREAIQKTEFRGKFLDKYTAGYNDLKVIRYQDNAGLGQGFASMAIISYINPTDSDGTDVQDKGGIMAVTNYGDQVYVVECSSYLPVYKDYHAQFMDFFKSISFKKAYHESIVGDYRNFLAEMPMIDVPFPNAVSRSTY